MSREALAIQTAGLSKRYRSTWGLQDCSIDVPVGRISALVGPNGVVPAIATTLAVFLAVRIVLALALAILTYWSVTTRDA